MSILMGQLSNTVYEVLMGMDPIVPIWKDLPASASQTANPLLKYLQMLVLLT